MTLDEICALPIAEICTSDAMLFLWVPPPLLRNGIIALESWGFEYLTSAVWDKACHRHGNLFSAAT
jgi:N6-adenosine-specific RNA methylase IME4